MRTLLKYFLEGCLVLAPIAASAWVVTWLIRTLDRWVGVPVPVPGSGLAITLVLVTLVGALASNFVGRRLVALADHIARRLPLVQLVYASIQDLFGAFVGEKKTFDRPVLVALSPGSAARALGFITREEVPLPGCEGRIAVYLPQSYNFAGMVLLVPREDVEPLDVSRSEFMTFIVSGGVSGARTAAATRTG